MQWNFFQTILAIIFGLFTMLWYLFDSPQANQDLISSIKNFVYELPQELPQELGNDGSGYTLVVDLLIFPLKVNFWRSKITKKEISKLSSTVQFCLIFYFQLDFFARIVGRIPPLKNHLSLLHISISWNFS